MLTLHHNRRQRYIGGAPGWACSFEPGEVFVAARGPHSAVVCIDGFLTEATAAKFVNTVIGESARPGVRIVYSVFTSLNGELNNLGLHANALDLIPERVAKVAFLGAACGPALIMASRCDVILAARNAVIGQLDAWADDGTPEPALTASMQAHLAHQLPHVTPATWRRIESHAISAEEAEARGLVGGLYRSIWDRCSLREGEGVETC